MRYGQATRIGPHEIATDGINRLDWPRDDLNLACLELLIGLLFLADPPDDDDDWHYRYNNPDSDRLHNAFRPFSKFFELDGDGPRFLQDYEPFEKQSTSDHVLSPDMLFIDSAGANTSEKNSDLMVKRDRYMCLDLPLAAMSLYTLQAFSPSGGSGHRTSMRGGGPMVTLMKPLDEGACPLWRLLWCNVPKGHPLKPEAAVQALPWLRPTRTSEKEQIVTPDRSHPAEAFFGIPRRIRLRFEGDAVTGVVQKRYGTNYKGWIHPLSPYYSKEAGGERLPNHPKPGKLSYQNWLGLVFGQDNKNNPNQYKASVVSEYQKLTDAPYAEVYVGGWAMNNMKPRDFNLHVYPSFSLNTDMESQVVSFVEAANHVAKQLKQLLKSAVSLKGEALDVVRESFFTDTEHDFVCAVRDIATRKDSDAKKRWISKIRQTALTIFDQYTLSTLSDRNLSDIESVVSARRKLLSCFSRKNLSKIFPDLTDEE